MFLPCIALLRPYSESSPSMIRFNNEYLYPKILKELLSQEVFQDIVISVSPDTPKEMIDIISNWGVKYVINKNVLPQHKVLEIAKYYGWNIVCCISAYTYFYDKNGIFNAFDMMVQYKCDYSGMDEALSNQEFCIIGKKTLDFFNKITDRSIVPSKPHAIKRNSNNILKGFDVQNLSRIGERFIWLSSYAGETAMMPKDFIVGYYEKTSISNWFKKESRELWTAKYFGVEDMSFLELNVNKLLHNITIEKLVGQLRWPLRFDDYFVDCTGSMLELGFGNAPIVSYMLGSKFSDVIAIEPFENYKFDEQAIISLICNLPACLYKNQKINRNENLSRKISVYNKNIEELNLQSSSVDICISKMVFEHVEDVEKLSKEIFRVLKTDGFMIHEIGLNDHTGGSNSGIHFAFLKYSKKDWNIPWKGTNLWRINDFIDCWKSIGFNVEIVSRIQSKNIPNVINEYWNSYCIEDLLCQVAVIKATKE